MVARADDEACGDEEGTQVEEGAGHLQADRGLPGAAVHPAAEWNCGIWYSGLPHKHHMPGARKKLRAGL